MSAAYAEPLIKPLALNLSTFGLTADKFLNTLELSSKVISWVIF